MGRDHACQLPATVADATFKPKPLPGTCPLPGTRPTGAQEGVCGHLLWCRSPAEQGGEGWGREDSGCHLPLPITGRSHGNPAGASSWRFKPPGSLCTEGWGPHLVASLLFLPTHLPEACVSFLPSEFVGTGAEGGPCSPRHPSQHSGAGTPPPAPHGALCVRGSTPFGIQCASDLACPSRTGCLGEVISF